ncbi:hypothetical protein QR680_013045 [Steinernema hermaphroditum]|uniref:3-dehydrosphinganine reductase n=1 Tax=Steinernema hermaphroditum TaxID=289476 RepID=A0AA39M1N0_9BILA|nr:hypothetical protein QR680_013045 [Steinernema hermaphroditum]
MPNRPQSGQGALSTEPKQNKLTVKVEFESIPNRFGIEEFRVLIEEALKTILGLGAPICTVDSFEDNSLKGSIIFESTNLHTVWAALSIYGFHFGRNVAIHLNKMFCCWFTAGAAFVLSALVAVLYYSLPKKKQFVFRGKHAFVTGGSKGIGKQIALELIRKGCSVSIAARNVSDLESTAKELKTLCDSRGEGQKVQWYSFDVTESYEKTESVIREAEKELGPVGVLINNAGFSTQEAFHDLPLSAFENQMKVNYLSGVYASRAVFSSMKSLGGGHIGFVSSAAGQCAIWGYTAYSPAKFAVRGFAEALHMEMLPFNIGVSVLFPPNTATEGFQVELDTMPEQVKLISDSAGLFEPDYVAKTFVSDIEAGEFATTIGLDGWMLGNLTVGAAPEKNLLRAIQQVLFAGVFRGVMLGYIGYFNRMVRRCHKP